MFLLCAALLRIQGYSMATQFDHVVGLPRKVCLPNPPAGMPTWASALIGILAPAAGLTMLLMMLIFSNHALHQIKFKPTYLRRIELNQRRSKGVPKAGENASVVVTDIEGYSSE